MPCRLCLLLLLSASPVSAEGFLTFPLPKVVAPSTPFWGYTTKDGRPHGGNDYKPIGPVLAAADGVVIKVSDFQPNTYFGSDDRRNRYIYGNEVRILHDNGYITIYAHLKTATIEVEEGQRVVRGQILAEPGDSGYATGPHLHFELTRGSSATSKGTPIDPYAEGLWLRGEPRAVEPVKAGAEPSEPKVPPGLEPFRVVSTSPKDGEDWIDCSTVIEVEFSQAVSRQEVQGKLQIEPSPLVPLFYDQVSGRKWRVGGFLLERFTSYRCTVPGSIMSNGARLGSPHTFEFTTSVFWPVATPDEEAIVDIFRLDLKAGVLGEKFLRAHQVEYESTRQKQETIRAMIARLQASRTIRPSDQYVLVEITTYREPGTYRYLIQLFQPNGQAPVWEGIHKIKGEKEYFHIYLLLKVRDGVIGDLPGSYQFSVWIEDDQVAEGKFRILPD